MKLYKIKINSNSKVIFEFINFAEKYKINIYISYTEEDLFADVLFMYIGVKDEYIQTFENKYSKQVVETGLIIP